MTAAGVHLECLLIRIDINLDAGPLARKRCDGARVVPVVRAVLSAVDKVAVVVASAVEATVAGKLRCSEVGANLLRGGPEVVDRVLLVGKDSAIRDEDVIDTDTLARVRQVEGVVQCSRRIRVGETIQVPVGLLKLVIG